jgi:hypothetical protein
MFLCDHTFREVAKEDLILPISWNSRNWWLTRLRLVQDMLDMTKNCADSGLLEVNAGNGGHEQELV